ncbi:MAG TPA: aspartate-semialdehyde dehydrogenase [Gemmatimonadaceae bacterium]|nr:aspartate-semialdehyde dehydrogenase [Gemmatimonadaceae bacterium]
MRADPNGRAPRAPVPVAVLGATGAVGQTFIRLLAHHPWFRIAELAASERSAGKAYGDAARWLEGGLPHEIAAMTVLPCDPSVVRAPLVFSALDAGVAGDVEAAFARAGRFVLSNARNFRMDADVPLLIPEVNPEHLALLDVQRARRGWDGAIITNANCATMVIAMALAPLHAAFGIETLFAMTMQAVSGAGYPGVPSLDILGNVIPFIKNEEEKIESETLKILGRMERDAVVPAPIRVSAQANRVPVENGHTACMVVGFSRRVAPDEATHALTSFRSAVADVELPSAPARPLIVVDAPDRPQPKRDAGAGNGMSIVIGRVRRDPILDVRLVASGHNTIRGAAGASILNAELLVARGLLASAPSPARVAG